MHQTQWSPERPLPPPVSLVSQSHHEKPPEVTCRSRGNPGFPASTRERPRETFFNTSRGQIPLPWLGSNDALPLATRMETRLPWRPTRGSLTSPSYLVRDRTLGPPLENNPEILPSSRDEGLRLLHGLEANLATSLQTPQEACLPLVHPVSSKRYPSRFESRAGFFASTRDECLSPRVRLECNPEIPVAPGEEHWLLDTSLDEVYWPCRNSRNTTWLPRHRKMKPFPATAPQEKSHVRNWRSRGHLAPLMRPTKFPEIPVSLERNTEVFRHPLLGALSPLLIWTGGSTPLLCLEGVPDLPVAPQDEAGLTKTFQTWPRGWFHIP